MGELLAPSVLPPFFLSMTLGGRPRIITLVLCRFYSIWAQGVISLGHAPGLRAFSCFVTGLRARRLVTRARPLQAFVQLSLAEAARPGGRPNAPDRGRRRDLFLRTSA